MSKRTPFFNAWNVYCLFKTEPTEHSVSLPLLIESKHFFVWMSRQWTGFRVRNTVLFRHKYTWRNLAQTQSHLQVYCNPTLNTDFSNHLSLFCMVSSLKYVHIPLAFLISSHSSQKRIYSCCKDGQFRVPHPNLYP